MIVKEFSGQLAVLCFSAVLELVNFYLCISDSNFDPLSCLLWKDVKFKKDSIIIHVKIPKSRNPEGDFIDLFRFDENSCCPVRALIGLKNHSALSSFPDKPVFSFDSGKLRTPSKFNNLIRSLLGPHLGNIADLVFRNQSRKFSQSGGDSSPERMTRIFGSRNAQVRR